MRSRLALLLTVLLLSACATNPVTGRREFMIISEQEEQALGDRAHPQVIEQFRIYDEKPDLNRMVTEIGQRIAAGSDRPELRWRFTLLDTPMVNAMALPGGYVYVTRGILERMNSEDELAGVIAHEMAHITARHTAQRISQAQLAQLGLMVGSILAGPAATQTWGGLAELGAGLLFQRYSRQQETQADLLGTAYMTEAGFNPVGAERMLEALRRLEKGEISPLERYFVDHPDPARRVQDVRSQIAQLRQANPAIGTSPMERDPFLATLDGMITGNSTLETTIRDHVVYQRRYGIIVPVPQGWVGRAGTGDLFVMAPPKGANTAFIAQEVPVRRLQGFRDAQTAIRTQPPANGTSSSRGDAGSDAHRGAICDRWMVGANQVRGGPGRVDPVRRRRSGGGVPDADPGRAPHLQRPWRDAGAHVDRPGTGAGGAAGPDGHREGACRRPELERDRCSRHRQRRVRRAGGRHQRVRCPQSSPARVDGEAPG